jgi:O-acetyl-ADP-ribose deacetylase (regulator of RNase III)
MIQYTKGNLLEARTEALVNTVNTVGVMGKGIALQFKERYKENYRVYRKLAKEDKLAIGDVLAVKDLDLSGERWILNFPTKKHWKGKSQYEFIESGLIDLKKKLADLEIKSIAIPPLGCGYGGLDWKRVKKMIESTLGDLDIEIVVYEPNEQIKRQLQKQAKPKEVALTPARAMLLYLLFAYEQQGEESSVFVANKLAYFLQESGEKLRLNFEKHYYGPYSVQLQHVLYNLNGEYLFGLEQNEIKPFEPIRLNYDRVDEVIKFVNKELSIDQRNRLKSVMSLISGFESTFSLELLATVDFLTKNKRDKKNDEVREEIKDWSSRKTKIFKSHYIDVALERLKSQQNTGLFALDT